MAAAVGAGSLARSGRVCWRIALAFSAPAAAGALLGTLVRATPVTVLARAFAVVACVVALGLLVDVLLLGGPPTA